MFLFVVIRYKKQNHVKFNMLLDDNVLQCLNRFNDWLSGLI